MPKTVELTGMRFGSLVVQEKSPGLEDRYYIWRCKCDCGNEVLVNTKRLTRGTVQNCGCSPKPNAGQGSRAEDLTGRIFGSLTAIEREKSRNGRTYWLCQCVCGNRISVQTYDLKRGHTESCGCHRKHRLKERIADITNQKFGRLTALYPTDNRDNKGSVYWHCRCDCGKEVDITEDGLVHGNYKSCGCRKKEIMESIPEYLTLIDGTCVEWLKNRKSRCDNTSGFRGVSKTRSGAWKVFIGLQNKRYYLGTYHDYEEAVRVRLDAEEQLHDGFVAAYSEWQRKANQDAKWATAHPFYFRVTQTQNGFIVQSTEVTDYNENKELRPLKAM